MSSPKPVRILQAIGARAAVIATAAGYYTDIGTDVQLERAEPGDDDAPCTRIWLQPRSLTQDGNTGQRVSQQIVVAGYERVGVVDREVRGQQILADIQRAIELPDTGLGNLLLIGPGDGGLLWQADQVVYEENSSVVCGQVAYAIPHRRKAGDPEIA
jgi:hypothetical protein